MIDVADLAELNNTILTGVTVGVGSQILLFDNGTSILIQCGYECYVDGRYTYGDGEKIDTANFLFPLLNGCVCCVSFNEDFSLGIKFKQQYSLQIVPERNGMESYVVSTRNGICPVIYY